MGVSGKYTASIVGIGHCHAMWTKQISPILNMEEVYFSVKIASTQNSTRFQIIWGVPTRAHCLPPRISRVVGDICRILCPKINRSMCTL